MKKFCVIFLFLIIQCAHCFGQNIPSLVLTQIAETNGLSDNNVQCILKDSEGKVWVGTSAGLNLLDGSVIRNFFSVPGQQSSLPSNNILSLAADANSNTWIGTAAGLCSYQKNNQTFFSVPVPASEYGNTAIINSICPITPNLLWCGTAGGLFLFDISKKKFTAYFNTMGDEKNNHRLCNNINKLLLDSDKNLWVCSKDGLWRFDINKKEFIKINGQKNGVSNNPVCLYAFESSDKKTWIGHGQTGLQQVEKLTDSVISFQELPGAVENVSCINEIKRADGKYLLLLNGQLQAFDPFLNKFLQLQKPLSLQQYPDVRSIHSSADGWLWLGTSTEGLFVANPQTQHFQQHFFDGSISTQPVVISETDSTLLIGAEGSNLLKSYSDNWQLATNFYDNIFPSPANKDVFATVSMVKENSNSWWLGTSAGLAHINPTNYGRRWFTTKKTDSTRLPSNFINHIFLDSEKQLWVFPLRQGIWKMDMATRKFRQLFSGFIQQNVVEKKLTIADAAEDSAGNIWMADVDEGIILFEKSSNNFSKPFTTQLGEKLATTRVYYRNNFLYSFTGNILLKWKDKSTLQKIILPEGMNKELYDMAFDTSGNCWLASKSGLICYNEQQNSFKKFTSSDGLISNAMDGKLYGHKNGEMVFASPTYCTTFYPNKLLINSSASLTLLLTGVYANDSLVAINKNSIHFNPWQNNIVFRWALPSFVNPFGNNYYCQLKDIDTTWRYVGNRGEMQYANLAAGNYIILLKATTANGISAANIISLQFTVQAPYWQRTWFLLSVAALLATLIFWLVRKRIKAIRRKAALQKQLVELEMKAIKAQMNPDFIFSSLNSIQENIAAKNNDAAHIYVSKFSMLVKRILENSGRTTITITEELELIKEYVSLQQLRFTDEIKFSIQNKFSHPQFEIPSMILQPFIENALWHGLVNKPGEKRLQVLLYESKHTVNIVIEDNGIGRKAASAIPKKEGKVSMGLQTAKERLEFYSYASTVEIIDLTDEQGHPSGTKVIIHLPNY